MNDAELRAHFAHLRSELANSAPAFRSLLARKPARAERARAWTPGLAIPALCVLALAVWWVSERRATTLEPSSPASEAFSPASEAFSPAVLETFSTWGTPTDYLLRPPGYDLGSTLPQFGVDHPVYPARRSGEPRSQVRTRRTT